MEPTNDPRVALVRLLAARDDGRLQPVLDAHGIDLVVAHGSITHPDAAPSDLDLAIGHAGRANLLQLWEDLYHLTRYETIDLLDLETAGIVARGLALGHGNPLVEAVPGTFAEQQMVALAMLWDTRWLRDLELDQLANG